MRVPVSLCAFLVAHLALAAAIPGLAEDVGSNAPQDVALTYQINTTHTGALQTSGINPPLTVKWSVSLPAGTASYPIVVNGKVFVIGFGSPTVAPTLYALDARSGSTIWSQPVPAGYGGWVGAAYESGNLFVVPESAPNVTGAMFAFRATDGTQLWNVSLPGQYSFSSAPTAYNGVVYTGGAGSGGTVYAVRETDGAILWTGSVENGDSSSPAVNQTGVYVSYACPQSYRFNAISGKLIWHYSGECEGGGGNTAVLYRGLLYVRDLYNFSTSGISLSAKNGMLVGPGFNSQYSPAFSNGSGFFVESNLLSAVDLATGATLWTAIPPNGDSYSVSPIVVNGVVYVGTSAGNLMGYDATSGIEVVAMFLGSPIPGGQEIIGMGAGPGLLVVPAGSEVIALQ